jgi:hypothetical protein
MRLERRRGVNLAVTLNGVGFGGLHLAVAGSLGITRSHAGGGLGGAAAGDSPSL